MLRILISNNIATGFFRPLKINGELHFKFNSTISQVRNTYTDFESYFTFQIRKRKYEAQNDAQNMKHKALPMGMAFAGTQKKVSAYLVTKISWTTVQRVF